MAAPPITPFNDVFVLYADVWARKQKPYTFYKAVLGGEPVLVPRYIPYLLKSKAEPFAEYDFDKTTGKTLSVVCEQTIWDSVYDYFDYDTNMAVIHEWQKLRDGAATTREDVERFCQDLLRECVGDGKPRRDEAHEGVLEIIRGINEHLEDLKKAHRKQKPPPPPPKRAQSKKAKK